MTSWVPGADGSPFGPENLPYGVFSRGDDAPRVGVAIGTYVLDVAAAMRADGFTLADAMAEPALNRFLALGPNTWIAARRWILDRLTNERHRATIEPALVPLDEVRLHLPFTVADYVDFYASEHHARAVGEILRPGEPPLPPAWKHLPIGYHGRAGTVVVSGTPVVRPAGQHKPPGIDRPTFGPSTRLDFEAEVGFVIGTPSSPGIPVPVDRAPEHLFGVVLVNDWSARDIQAWEYRPLGPFLGKAFATSISPWVVPMAALDAARVPAPTQDPKPLPYLRGDPLGGLDLTLEICLNGKLIATPPYAAMYWTPGQLIAHLTSGGTALRTGDLLASGTVSGPGPHERGSLIELTHAGSARLAIGDGNTRAWLEDGDEVVIIATAPGPAGSRLGLGEVRGRVVARPESTGSAAHPDLRS